MARAQGARAQTALAFESVYGTAPASGFSRMPFARSNISQRQPLLASELLGNGRDPVDPILDAVTAGGDVVVPIDAEAFGVWLKAAFGAPDTTGTDPYTHVFESGGWSLPSFSFETGLPEVPHFAMAKGCKVDQLQWTMQRSGLLTATVTVVAQGEDDPASSSAAGTLDEFTLIRFGHFNGSVKRNGTALANVVSAEITYMNNLDPVETIRSDGKIDGADESMAACSGRITVRFSDQTLLTQATDGTACALEFALSNGTQSFTFSVARVFLPRPEISVEGPGGVQVTFDWQAAKQTNGDPMVTATLVNSVDAY